MLVALWVSMTVSFAVSASLPAVTVTVRAVFQFAMVKVRVPGVGVTSVPACPATVTTTSAVGWISRTTA